MFLNLKQFKQYNDNIDIFFLDVTCHSFQNTIDATNCYHKEIPLLMISVDTGICSPSQELEECRFVPDK